MSSYARPTRITSQIVDRNMQLRRENDIQKRELKAFGDETSKLLYAAGAQSKVESRRHQTQLQACKQEQLYEDQIREHVYQQRIRELTDNQNQALASELDRETAQEERHSRELQRLCEESPELKELEKALNLAFLNKERAMQLEQKNLLAARERERIQAIEDKMEYDRLRSQSAEIEQIEAQRDNCRKQRDILQNQILERQSVLKEAQRQTEIDKAMINEIVERINMEDEMDMKKRRERQEMTAKIIQDYGEQRKREILEKKAKDKADEEEILKFAKAVEQRSEGVAAIKKAKKDEEDRLLQKIVEESERKKREEDEFNYLRDLLWEEELEEKRKQDEIDRKLKQQQVKKDMMTANEQMKLNKLEVRQKEAETEMKMVALMRKKFAEDEAKERMDEEARRRTKLQHMSAIEKQRHERMSLVEQEKAIELAEREDLKAKEDYRKKVIQEARKRLLEEHAAKLDGYLPRGALANSEEFEVFQRAAASSRGR